MARWPGGRVARNVTATQGIDMTGRSTGVALLICTALAGAGCGGSDSADSTTTATVATTPQGTTPATTTGAAADKDLTARLLKRGEMTGFSPADSASVVRKAGTWLRAVDGRPSTQAKGIARLKRFGFVEGARADLNGPGGAPGVSLVERFRSAAGAKAELAEVTRVSGNVKAFPVPVIPGARGFGIPAAGGFGAANVAFADGPYVYVVGATKPPSGPATRALVTDAAHDLYDRVHE